jgi:hypothetical protein
VGPSAASGPLNGATSATVSGDPVGWLAAAPEALEAGALAVLCPAGALVAGALDAGAPVLVDELHAVSAASAAAQIAASSKARLSRAAARLVNVIGPSTCVF